MFQLDLIILSNCRGRYCVSCDPLDFGFIFGVLRHSEDFYVSYAMSEKIPRDEFDLHSRGTGWRTKESEKNPTL